MATLLNTLQIRLHGGGGGASLYSSAFPWPRSHNKMGQIHNKCNYKYAMTNANTKRGKKASLSLSPPALPWVRLHNKYLPQFPLFAQRVVMIMLEIMLMKS